MRLTPRSMTLSRRAYLTGTGVALALGGLTHARPAAAAPKSSEPRSIDITARSIANFSRTDAGKRRFGSLEFRGGLVLASSDPGFGGLSGLIVEPDGRRLLSVSDEGMWLAATLVTDNGRPSGLTAARLGPFRALSGRLLDRKRDLDAEALALVEGNLTRGTVLIGFERNHRIGRFPIVDGVVHPPVGVLKLPPEARRMRANKGFEAVAILQGGPHKGAIIAFSERFPDTPTQHTGWLWIGGEPRAVSFPGIDGFEVTDAASLPDGALLVLERRFRWTEGVKMRIRRFPADAIRPGAMPIGETLIEADLTAEIDNMEGLAVHRTATGETLLTLLSDNNFSPVLQRTVLLQFAVVG